jgi:hypothetical protein
MPQHVRLTCLIARNGVPYHCFPADIAGPAKSWEEFFRRTRAYLEAPGGTTKADEQNLELMTAAMDRVLSSRMMEAVATDPLPMRAMLFDVLISPTDARSASIAGEPLRMKDVQLEKEFDPSVLTELYPSPALTSGVEARVAITCEIEADRSLLCLTPGKIEPLPGKTIEPWLSKYFLLSAYQAASTIRLAPSR